jgi:hypothetical protein
MTLRVTPFTLRRLALDLYRFGKRLVRQAERRSRYRRMGWI